MKKDKQSLIEPDQDTDIFPSNETLLIGSARDCDITIRDKSISPHHLSIVKLSKLQFRIEDLKSSAGTYTA